MKLALLGASFGDVDMEEADRVGLGAYLPSLSPLTTGSRQIPCHAAGLTY